MQQRTQMQTDWNSRAAMTYTGPRFGCKKEDYDRQAAIQFTETMW